MFCDMHAVPGILSQMGQTRILSVKRAQLSIPSPYLTRNIKQQYYHLSTIDKSRLLIEAEAQSLCWQHYQFVMNILKKGSSRRRTRILTVL